MTGKRVVVLGNPVVDYALQVDRLPVAAGECHDVNEFRVGAGGTANMLISGARLGLAMQALGIVGDDAAGRQLIEWLAKEGIDTGTIIEEPGQRTTTVFVLVAPDGSASFLGYHNATPLQSMPVAWAAAIRNAAGLSCDGWTYGSPGPDVVLAAVQIASSVGVPVFFDPGPRVGEMAAEWLHDILRHVSVVSLTEDEARTLMPGTDRLEDMARVLRARGPRRVVVKRGASGCLVHDGTAIVSHAGFDVPAPVDTTGAGDAVTAALVLAWLRGYDLATTAALADAAGAAAVQRLGGGLNMPSASAISDLLLSEGITHAL